MILNSPHTILLKSKTAEIRLDFQVIGHQIYTSHKNPKIKGIILLSLHQFFLCWTQNELQTYKLRLIVIQL